MQRLQPQPIHPISRKRIEAAVSRRQRSALQQHWTLTAMWEETPARPRRPQSPPTAAEIAAANRSVITSALLMCGLAFALGLIMPVPGPAVPAIIEVTLFFAALGAGLLALHRGHRFLAPHLTQWDQGLFLLLMSRISGIMVDKAALIPLLEQQRPL